MGEQDANHDADSHRVVVEIRKTNEFVRVLQALREMSVEIGVELAEPLSDFASPEFLQQQHDLRSFLSEKGFSDVDINTILISLRSGKSNEPVKIEVDSDMLAALRERGLLYQLVGSQQLGQPVEASEISGHEITRETGSEAVGDPAKEPEGPFSWDRMPSWKSARLIGIGGVGGVLAAAGVSHVVSQGLTGVHAVGALAVVLLLIGVDRMVALVEMMVRERGVYKDAKATARRIAQMEI